MGRDLLAHHTIDGLHMRISRFWLTGAVALVLAAGLIGVPSTASAAVPATVRAVPSNVMPVLASSGSDGTVEVVRQLVPCGGMMYAVGRFNSISQLGIRYTRFNVFSFNATTGAVSASFVPTPNGYVNSIALSANCGTAYLGGLFTTVGGVRASDVAAVSASTGALISTFTHSANGQIEALLIHGNHLLVGGYFTAISGSARSYLASLNPITGQDDGYVHANLSGHYVYTNAAGRPAAANPTRVFNFSRSPNFTKLLVMGDFTTAGNLGRRQIFMLDLGASTTWVDTWYSSEFLTNCAVTEPFWLQDASWSPDDQTIYVVGTGFRPASGLGYSTTDPRAGLCDAAAAFPATPGPVSHRWINWTGCDSLYATAADSTTAYIGGHERWASNGRGCDSAGPGAIAAPGMAGLSPTNGGVVFNPTRSRGYGADDMVVTFYGLWIASDNYLDAQDCAGESGHEGICFLPK
ncbi:MAG: hypothetical protein M3042_06315 [Actinomycetota bacterium]|nr:hypothetical protein [Actinomycetota bacterium]